MSCNFYGDGADKAPQRSLFNALGMTKEEMERPLVGIVSSYNEIVPGHMNLDKIAEAVKLGVAEAGGTPVRHLYLFGYGIQLLHDGRGRNRVRIRQEKV